MTKGYRLKIKEAQLYSAALTGCLDGASNSLFLLYQKQDRKNYKISLIFL